MKLSGNKKNGRYAANSERQQTPQINRQKSPGSSQNLREQPVDRAAARAAAKRKKMRRARRILTVILLIVIALSAVIFCVYKFGVRAPRMKDRIPVPSGASANEGSTPLTPSSDRKGTQYTFVILGFDDGNGNTDTIMVANFDVDHHKLSVVNIPRDTLVNVKWSLKKANTLYSSGGGITGVTKGLSDILGFQVDFYVKVNLKAFASLVDAIGGVNFDVPVNMNYDDPVQDLHIHLNKGMQLLDGAKALQVVRCRSVYSTADIGRIETQQLFLRSAAEQILQNQKKLNITELAGIFMNDVETDLDVGEVVWLGKEFYKMDAENITFTTIPADYWDTVNKTSYVTIYINDWLKLLNEKINPYKDEITEKDLSILTRNANGKLYVTNGVFAGKQSWGSLSSSSSSSAGSSGSSSKPSAKPSPSPTPESSPSPSPSASPDTSPSPGDASASPDNGTQAGAEVSPEPSPEVSPSASTDGSIQELSPADSAVPSPSAG